MNFLSILSNLDWRQPLWLLLMFQPLVLWLVIRIKSSRASNQFADKHLLPWVKVNEEKSLMDKIFSRDTAYWVSMILLAIAIAGPRTPLESIKAKQASALDIMVVVDVSASMKVRDIKPSRIQRGVQELHELLSKIQRDDIRLGSVVYAARAHVFVPITSDINALKFYLKDLSKLVLPTKGSDASVALIMAAEKLQAVNSKQKQAKAILWLTDGDFSNTQDESKIEATLKALKSQNIPTFILGIGTEEGSAIPLRKGGWLEQNGQGVISKMDAGLLENLAKIAGGKFSKIFNDESDWEALYTQGLLSSVTVKQKVPDENEDQQWVVYYPWFLFAGLIFLLFSLVPFKRTHASQPITSIVMGALFISFLFSLSSELYANEKSTVNELMQTALQESVKNYNNKEYALATSGFIATILQAKTDSDRGKAMHNLGNNYFQQGDYENAAQLYKDALRYAPNQIQSQHNLLLTTELNDLLQRRRSRGIGMRSNQATGRGFLGSQNQTASNAESRMAKPKNLTLPEIPQEYLNDLLNKGLAHLQMQDSEKTKQERQEHRKIEQARISLLRDQDSSPDMWKRLFEIEEGFPAKLDEPKSVPGQQPW